MLHNYINSKNHKIINAFSEKFFITQAPPSNIQFKLQLIPPICSLEFKIQNEQISFKKKKDLRASSVCLLQNYSLLRPPSSIIQVERTKVGCTMKIWWIQFFGLMFTQLSPGVFKVDLTQVFVWNCVAAKHS